MRHVGPGVVGERVIAEDGLRAGPSEGAEVFSEPELEPARLRRLQVLDHRAEAGIDSHQVRADVREHADRDAEDDDVLRIHLDRHALHVGPGCPPILEVVAAALECLGLLEPVVIVGRSGPAWQPAHVDQRIVLAAALDRRLAAHLDATDPSCAWREAQRIDAVEKLEALAATPRSSRMKRWRSSACRSSTGPNAVSSQSRKRLRSQGRVVCTRSGRRVGFSRTDSASAWATWTNVDAASGVAAGNPGVLRACATGATSAWSGALRSHPPILSAMPATSARTVSRTER